MKICVIGCGPDAIFAAHAAITNGHEVSIFALEKRAWPVIGPDHLTHEIPGLSKDVEKYIEYTHLGERGSFGKKIRGSALTTPEWNLVDPGLYPMWSLRGAYTNGWLKYHGLISTGTLGDPEKYDADLIINTQSPEHFCVKPRKHSFRDRTSYLKAQPIISQPNRIVLCGQAEVDWYCWSIIENICSWEFTKAPNILSKRRELIERVHPEMTDCDCRPDIVRVGRWGRFDDMIMPAESYRDALQAISAPVFVA